MIDVLGQCEVSRRGGGGVCRQAAVSSAVQQQGVIPSSFSKGEELFPSKDREPCMT